MTKNGDVGISSKIFKIDRTVMKMMMTTTKVFPRDWSLRGSLKIPYCYVILVSCILLTSI